MCDFKGSEAYLCLWKERNSLDDCLNIGTDIAVEELISALKGNEFVLKVEDNFTDYLIFKIVQKIDKGKFWIMQNISLNT
jgi:hypothetical protein